MMNAKDDFKRLEEHIKNEQESKMQKFENGEPVTIEYAENGSQRDAEWIGMNGLLHVVKLKTGGFCEFGDDYIRPLIVTQLICDEARDLIKEANRMDSLQYKVICHNVDEYNELMNIANANMYYAKDFNNNGTKPSFKEKCVPELNLKTGVVTPAVEEELSVDLLGEVSIRDHQLREVNKAYDVILKSNLALTEQLAQEQTKVDELTRLNIDSRKCIVKLQEEAEKGQPTKRESICVVHGCSNKRYEGQFVGNVCAPCWETLLTGDAKHSGSFIGDFHRRGVNAQNQLKEKDAEIERLLLELKNIRNLANAAYQKGE